jgi:hypothetical protein
MRFFALAWVVLLPYYALQQYLAQLPDNALQQYLIQLPDLKLVAEFLPTYSGVLLLLTTEPLWREAANRDAMGEGVLWWIDWVIERCVYLLVFPHAILFVPVDPSEQFMFIRCVDLALAAIAYVSIGVVLIILTNGFWSRVLWWGFLVVAAAYFVTLGWWTYDGAAKMKDGFLIAFAVYKVMLSLIFLTLVTSIADPPVGPFPDGPGEAPCPHKLAKSKSTNALRK